MKIRYYEHFVALSLFGYVFIAALSNLIIPDGVSSPISIVYRAIVFCVSLVFIISNFHSKINVVSRFSFLCIILYVVFISAYGLRLLHDYIAFSTTYIDGKLSEYLVFGFFIGFIPALAFARENSAEVLLKIVKLSFVIIAIGLFINLLLAIQNFISGSGLENSRMALERLSPIQIGKYSAFLLIISIGLLSYVDGVNKYRYVFISCILLSVFSIFISGSRTALVAVMFVYAVNSMLLYDLKKSVVMLFLFGVGLLLVVFVSPYIFGDIDFLSSFYNMGSATDKSANIRYGLFSGALEQFSKSPIIGDFFLEKKHMYAPHNIYIEILMSLGVFGISIFGVLITFALRNFYIRSKVNTSKNRHLYMIYLNIYVYLLIASCFSLGITSAPELWALTILGICFTRETYD